MTHTVLTPQVLDVAISFMEGLDCPRSLTVAILLRHEMWDELTQLSVNPLCYSDSLTYLRDAAATEFFRKYREFPLDLDLEALAFEKWLWAEKECFKTNRRLYTLLDTGSHGGALFNEAVADFVSRVRKNVEWLLGDKPPEVFEGAFGPGATVSDTSDRTTVPHKMSSVPTLTPSAAFYLIPWTGTKWASATARIWDGVSFVKGNTFFTVDKTARTRRCCAKEPSLNSFYQLGLGRVMRKRLKDRGFDLDNGQNVHRQVACLASKTGEFCTIDLSSASDTVSTSLVELVVPHKWREAMNDLRSSHTKVKGKWYRLEKFSSMGNGFTFELETTLFAAICMAVLGDRALPGHNVFVYGDDIIVPNESYGDVISALKFFGFTPNPEKCYNSGYFRESCGGDFFNGVAVRPFYQKESIDEPQHAISMANGIRRLARENGHADFCWPALRRSWFRCLDLLPVAIRRCRGPEGLGDIVVHDDEERWDTRWRSSIRWVRVYRPAKFRRVSFDRFGPSVQLAAALYGVSLWPEKQYGRVSRRVFPEGQDGRMVTPRNAVLGYKVGWTPYS